MEETQIKGNIFENGLSLMENGVECWAIPAIDLLPPSLGTVMRDKQRDKHRDKQRDKHRDKHRDEQKF